MPDSIQEKTKILSDRVWECVATIINTRKSDEKDAWTIANLNLWRNFAEICMICVLSDHEETPTSFKELVKLALEKTPLPQQTKGELTTLISELSKDDLENPARIVRKLKLLAPDSAASQFKKVLLDSFKNNPVANQAYMRLIL